MSNLSTPVKAKHNRFGDEEQPSEAETPSRKRPLANVDTDKAAPADKIARIEVDVQRDGGLALIHGLPHGSSADRASRNELFMDVQEIAQTKYGGEINPTAKHPKYYGKLLFFQGRTWLARDGTEVVNAAYEVAPEWTTMLYDAKGLSIHPYNFCMALEEAVKKNPAFEDTIKITIYDVGFESVITLEELANAEIVMRVPRVMSARVTTPTPSPLPYSPSNLPPTEPKRTRRAT